MSNMFLNILLCSLLLITFGKINTHLSFDYMFDCDFALCGPTTDPPTPNVIPAIDPPLLQRRRPVYELRLRTLSAWLRLYGNHSETDQLVARLSWVGKEGVGVGGGARWRLFGIASC